MPGERPQHHDEQPAPFLNPKEFPEEMAIPGRFAYELRYGENPHQKAAVYFEPNTNSPLAHLKSLSGRESSLVNFTDIAAGIESVRLFEEPSAVVIKHNSPCGISLGESIETALRQAVAADPKSAFGGVVVLNKAIDAEVARLFADFKEEDGVQMDIIAASGISDKAVEIIKKVRKSTGIYTFGEIPEKRSDSKQIKPFDGGFIVQDWDDNVEGSFENWAVAGNFKPTAEQLKQMEIGWKFASRIKSNTVLVVDKSLPMTRGIGSGQTSRVGSTEIALKQAGEFAKGGILVSDSFFPFSDSVELAIEHGIGAVIQQGGSVNDKYSIEAADEGKIPMVFTGRRAFWH